MSAATWCATHQRDYARDTALDGELLGCCSLCAAALALAAHTRTRGELLATLFLQSAGLPLDESDRAALKRQLTRCDRQIAEYREQLPLIPALLSTRGIPDWQVERALILGELPLDEWPEEWIGDAVFPERRGWPCRVYRTLGARTALVEFFDGTAVFTAAANVRARNAGANPLLEAC